MDGITENDVFHIVLLCITLTLQHFLSTLFAGGTIVLVSRYSKSKFWEVMAKYHCTMTRLCRQFVLISSRTAFIS